MKAIKRVIWEKDIPQEIKAEVSDEDGRLLVVYVCTKKVRSKKRPEKPVTRYVVYTQRIGEPRVRSGVFKTYRPALDAVEKVAEERGWVPVLDPDADLVGA